MDQDTLCNRIEARLSELRTLRDEIRVHINLARREIMDEWQQLERRFPNVTEAGRELKESTLQTLDRLAKDARSFRDVVKGDQQVDKNPPSPPVF